MKTSKSYLLLEGNFCKRLNENQRPLFDLLYYSMPYSSIDSIFMLTNLRQIVRCQSKQFNRKPSSLITGI